MTDAAISSNPAVLPEKLGPQKIQPLRALIAVHRLLKNKEDTRQVFEIMQALNGKSTARAYRRLISTLEGGRLAYQRVELAPLFSDPAYTARFPIGTVGHTYATFMQAENLTADGLADESRKARGGNVADLLHPIAWFGRRIRDTHDIWHILTGYGRDGLGELCLVAFSYAQTRSLGWALIAVGGGLKALREPGGSQAVKAVWRAYQDGRKAAWLPGEDFERLMGEPLDAARRRLNIPVPAAYDAIPAEVRNGALRPATV